MGGEGVVSLSLTGSKQPVVFLIRSSTITSLPTTTTGRRSLMVEEGGTGGGGDEAVGVIVKLGPWLLEPAGGLSRLGTGLNLGTVAADILELIDMSPPFAANVDVVISSLAGCDINCCLETPLPFFILFCFIV
jgi:hypothetical protein